MAARAKWLLQVMAASMHAIKLCLAPAMLRGASFGIEQWMAFVLSSCMHPDL